LGNIRVKQTKASKQEKALNNTKMNTKYLQQCGKIFHLSGGYNPYLQVHITTVLLLFSSMAVLTTLPSMFSPKVSSKY